MPQLTETCDLWRMVAQAGGGKQMTAVYTRLPCLRVPISSFDKVAASMSAASGPSAPSEFMGSEARQSTDVFLLPNWAHIRPDDELRRGRRTDNSGNVVPFRYSVDGIRTYDTFAYQETIAVFAASLQ